MLPIRTSKDRGTTRCSSLPRGRTAAWPTNDDPNAGDLNGHFEFFVGSSTAAAVSGYPDITVPTGFDAELPIGITFIGQRWAEPKLLGLAYDYEQATHVRVPPQFIPTIGDALFPGVP